MARQYNVEGTKTFFYWSIALLILGLWCVKDGWFPSESVLAKHPLGDPQSVGFYRFNRVTAFLTLTASAICAYIHRIVR